MQVATARPAPSRRKRPLLSVRKGPVTPKVMGRPLWRYSPSGRSVRHQTRPPSTTCPSRQACHRRRAGARSRSSFYPGPVTRSWAVAGRDGTLCQRAVRQVSESAKMGIAPVLRGHQFDQRLEGRIVKHQGNGEFPRCGHSLVVGRDEPGALGAESEVLRRPVVSGRSTARGRCRVPDLERTVPAGRGDPGAVGGERQRDDRAVWPRSRASSRPSVASKTRASPDSAPRSATANRRLSALNAIGAVTPGSVKRLLPVGCVEHVKACPAGSCGSLPASITICVPSG